MASIGAFSSSFGVFFGALFTLSLEKVVSYSQVDGFSFIGTSSRFFWGLFLGRFFTLSSENVVSYSQVGSFFFFLSFFLSLGIFIVSYSGVFFWGAFLESVFFVFVLSIFLTIVLYLSFVLSAFFRFSSLLLLVDKLLNNGGVGIPHSSTFNSFGALSLAFRVFLGVFNILARKFCYVPFVFSLLRSISFVVDPFGVYSISPISLNSRAFLRCLSRVRTVFRFACSRVVKKQ